ncbi:5625_t:CDS:2, partial [Acaulospora morrowiae]
MYTKLETLKYLFEDLKFSRDENGALSFDPSVMIYCQADIDAICAAEILKKIFYYNHIIWSFTPVKNPEEFVKIKHSPSFAATSLRAIILLNVGGDVDLFKYFDLLHRPELSVFVLDSKNSINLRNLFVDHSNVFVLIDEESEQDQKLIEKAARKEELEKVTSVEDRIAHAHLYRNETDDFGRSKTRTRRTVGSQNSNSLSTSPERVQYGPSIALQTYILSSEILLKENDMLWLAIIGQTSLFVLRKISLKEYDEKIEFLDAEVSEINDITSFRRVHRHGAVPSHPGDKKIVHINEYPFHFKDLKMKLKDNHDNLDRLLRDIGVPRRAAKQHFPSMEVKWANELANSIFSEGPKLGLLNPLYSSYCKFYGYGRPTLSASDVVYGLITLLKIKQSVSVEFNVEVQWINDFEGNDIWLNNFYTVVEALDRLILFLY